MLIKLNNIGDTIVEVLISIAALGLVATTGYTIAVKSADRITETQLDSNALQLAQSQIEFLRQSPSSDKTYFASAGSCFDQAGNVTTSCKFDPPYNINITEPTPNDSNETTYAVTVSWAGDNGANQSVTLYYEFGT